MNGLKKVTMLRIIQYETYLIDNCPINLPNSIVTDIDKNK